MNVLCIHAHFDDFEFEAGGIFELWRRAGGADLRRKVIVCTDGKAGGRSSNSRDEIGAVRLTEQIASAKVGGYDFAPLRYPDGTLPRDGGLLFSMELLAAVWKAIRDFQPHYLFAPPMPPDQLVGLHNDHLSVADAVRRASHLINVPHAFSPEYPMDRDSGTPRPWPVILNVYDSYMGGGAAFDLVVDIEDVFPMVCEMLYCHQSQINGWVPRAGQDQPAPRLSRDDWSRQLRERYVRQQRRLGLPTDRALETFAVTAWGQVPTVAQLLEDIPGTRRDLSRLNQLDQRLQHWRGL